MVSRRVAAIGAMAAMTLSICGSPAASGASSPEPTLRLRLGTAEHAGGPNDSPVLHEFAERVAELSGGQVQVKLEWGLADDTNDYEQKIIGMVRDGALDLGWTGTRAFDVLGVDSFEALQAPFLIDSNELLRQVMATSMPEQMLAGLDALGLEGLGAYPDNLRHPVGYHKPFVSLADFAGARIRVPTSDVSDAIYSALGSTPLHLNGVAFDEALSQGTLDGIDFAVIAAPNLAGAWATSNVVLYPRVSVMFLSAGVAAGMSADHLALLRTAAADALRSSMTALPAVDSAVKFCEGGGRVATATQTDLAAMKAATMSVTAGMRQVPQTNALIDQIEALKGSLSATEGAEVPAGCDQGAAPSIDPAGITAGTYVATASSEDAQRTGIPDECATQHGGLDLRLVIGSGLYSLFGSCDTVDEQKVDQGTYTSAAGTVEMSPTCCPGQSTVYSWKLADGGLTLAVIDESKSPPGDIPFNHFLYEHRWVAATH